MNDIEKLIEFERTQIGIADTGIYNLEYYGYRNNFYWCVVFQWYCFKMCGLSDLFYNGKKTNSCNEFLRCYPDSQVIKSDFKEGDLLLFSFREDKHIEHIGLCTGYYNGKIKSIDGNTTFNGKSSVVAEKLRDLDNVVCAVRPNYKEEIKTEQFRWFNDIDPKYRESCEKAYKKGILSLSEAGAVDITDDNLQVILWLDRLGLLEV